MKQQINYIVSQLQGYYPDEELRELAYWVAEEMTGLTRAEILVGSTHTQQLSEQKLEPVLQQLRAQLPVQYIFGHTLWNGLDLHVSPATLIPRPETAELVDWVLKVCDKNQALRVLDIGTGSGCIAIAIKKAAPQWQVTGLDISHEALIIAKQNAEQNEVDVNWIQGDILSSNSESLFSIPNIIISNPPYICEREKAEMDSRVLDYEPHTALFVPDNDPLLFYRRIASLALDTETKTCLFFEINEAYGKEVCDMLEEMGYTNIQLKLDIYGKQRMVFGTING